MSPDKKKSDLELSTIDYILVAGFFVVSIIIYLSYQFQNDLLCGYLVPGFVLVFTTYIFIDYLRQVFHFGKKFGDKKN